MKLDINNFKWTSILTGQRQKSAQILNPCGIASADVRMTIALNVLKMEFVLNR